MHSPLSKSHKFGLVFLPSIYDIPQRRGLSKIQDPLSAQHRDEGHEQCDGQTGEEDRLSSDDANGDIQGGR